MAHKVQNLRQPVFETLRMLGGINSRTGFAQIMIWTSEKSSSVSGCVPMLEMFGNEIEMRLVLESISKNPTTLVKLGNETDKRLVLA